MIWHGSPSRTSLKDRGIQGKNSTETITILHPKPSFVKARLIFFGYEAGYLAAIGKTKEGSGTPGNNYAD